jgi:sugar lactone lactonase YvrE
MLNKSLFSVIALAGLLVSAGCGGGGGAGSPATGGDGATTPPTTNPQTATNATATFHVDVASRKVTIQSLTGADSKVSKGAQSHAVFTGSAVGFTSSALLDQPGDSGLKVLSVSLTNHWGVPIGQTPDGAPTGLKVRFSNFTNVSAFSDLRPKTSVTTIAGTGSGGTQDGPVGSASFNLPVGVAAAGNGVYYVSEYNAQRIRKIANGMVSTLAGSGAVGGTNGAGLTASFNIPYAIALNPVDGALILAEFGGHRIRRITPDGKVTTVAGTGVAGSANGAGTAATFNQPIGVTVSASGVIYVTEQAGQDVRKIVLTGSDPTAPASYTVSKLAGTGSAGSTDGNGAGASFSSPNGIAIAPDGVLYIADRMNVRIRRIDTSGNVTTIAGTGVGGSADGSGNAATFAAPRGVAYVNGAIIIADGARIRQLTLKAGGSASPNVASSWQVATLAGSGAAGSSNGTGDVATFTNAQMITSDPSGNIIEADASHTVRKITPNSGAFPIGVASGTVPTEPVQLSNADSTIPNPGNGTNLPYIQYAGALAPGASSSAKNWTFIVPNGVTAFEFTTTVEADASILAPPGAVDNGPTPTSPNNVGSPDVEVRTLAGGGSRQGYLDGSVVNARFNGPEYIAADQAGNLYLSDQYNAAIRRISTSGVVSTIAGHIGGAPGYGDGAGNVAQLSYPSSIVVTKDGSTVYVADSVNNRIRRIALNSPELDPTISSNWTVSTVAGNGTAGGTYSTSVGTTAALNSPTGLTLDPGGNLYVTESAGNRVRRLQFVGGDPTSAANWQVTLVAGDTSAAAGAGGTTDNASGPSARFQNPTNIACDRSGTLYVTDTANHRIRKITADGSVTTLAGGIGGDVAASGYADGPALSSGAPVARFASPIGLCIDSAGYVYVGEGTNARIRRISPTGYVTTVAGTGSSGAADGSGKTCQFNGLASLAIAPSGTIYIGEVNNNGVRLLQRIINSGTL